MPRTKLKPKAKLHELSILGVDGDVDEDLMPDLDDDTLRDWLRIMLLGRHFEERRLKLQRQGRIGTFAPAIGQEASQVGTVAALSANDWVVPSFRESVAAIMRGVPLDKLLLYDAGYNEGGDISPELRVLPIAIPVASQLPYAAGLGYAAKVLDVDEVTMVYFGDGATSEGDFHESLNFAAVHQCPVVFVCQNNQWAISTPLDMQTSSHTLAQKAVAHGAPGIRVDGNDVLGVYVAATEAVERARNGGGPTLIECVTYRLSVHTTADDPSKYRSDEEVEDAEERDPILRYRLFLEERGLGDGVEELEAEIEQQLDDAWKATAERIEQLGGPAAMFDHVFETEPDYLSRQRHAATQEGHR